MPLAAVEPIIKFLPYQRAWMQDRSRFKIGMFARQTGKTFSNCAEIVESCIDHAAAGARTRWVILSRGERQAKEAMDEAVKPITKAFWEVYKGVLRGPPPEVEEGLFRAAPREGGVPGEEYRTFEVVYPGGSRITALPANADTARGFSANVLLDEFAFHADSKAIWGALFPVISKGGQVLRVVSTPNGKGNKFYDLMTARESVWSRHEVDIYEAVRQGLDRDIDQLRAGLGDADLWAQEFELKWLDEATAWLDYDLIAAAETPGRGLVVHEDYGEGELKSRVERGTPIGRAQGPVFCGMDIARKRDLTCIWVAELLGDVLYPREVITMRRAPFKAQHEHIARIQKRDRPVRWRIDQSGMGEPFVEAAQDQHGSDVISGAIFSPPVRFGLASLLKERMEDRRFRIPQGERDLREDLHSITKAVSNTGAVRLVHDGQSDGHGDRFWAAALCADAADLGVAEYDYHRVPKHRLFGDNAPAVDAFTNRRGGAFANRDDDRRGGMF